MAVGAEIVADPVVGIGPAADAGGADAILTSNNG
jgi:hypothetical protein